MSKEETHTLQIPIPLKTLEILNEACKRANNSQSFLSTWAIGIGLDDPYDIGKWVGNVISYSRKSNISEPVLCDEIRVKVHLSAETYYRLVKASEALGISHLKMAALLIRVVLTTTPLLQKMLGTQTCALVRSYMNGRDDLYFDYHKEQETIVKFNDELEEETCPQEGHEHRKAA